jgi:type VI secretion system protein ImpL
MDAAATGHALAEALAAYLDDYEHHWSGLVNDLRLRHAASDGEAIHQAQVLAASDGPLTALLRAVAQQTFLHKASASSVLGDAAAPLERLLEDRFAPLRELTQPGADGRRPLDSALADFNELHVLRALATSSANGGGSAEASLERFEHIRADSRRFPEPVRSMLLALAATAGPQRSESDATARTAAGSSLVR